ncbi:thiol:disulfide interchange protein [Bartonella australis AUST/NH1]|uniref:Thiol:disulfide interchange protein n=1 Tax=Bartonella australis (strain Aust/NH1) TaxID=1094489 RepID=M1P2I7_BARAA|nr:DsbE family thiol:disulfide interchange protein [Bartonella australis]AGF74005.1 thiol:disulfide interchange protein [Bartonella australis AUST/NH1]
MKITPLRAEKNTSFLVLFGLLGPFCLFFLFITLLLNSMNTKYPNDAAFIPNILVGKPAPETELPLLNSEGFLKSEQFKGRVILVNFWGSWCPSCREEHAILVEIAKDKRFNLIGINYKDDKDHAQRFLTNFGNPFKSVGFDVSGHAAINWGVYGPPETFILNKESTIIAKHIGPLTWQIYQRDILPKIEKALAAGESAGKE